MKSVENLLENSLQVAARTRNVPTSIFEGNRALLDAFRRGEREALASVYYHHVDAVGRLVRFGFFIDAQGLRIPGAPDMDAEQELVQEVFVRAFAERARLSYDGIRPYHPYLLRIAKNLLIDRQRGKGHAVAVDEELDHVEISLAVPGETEEDLHWQRLAAASGDYVAGLGPEMREVVRLRFEEDQSQQEVADTMKVSRRRVRTLEEKASVGLRRHLKRLKLLSD